MFYCFISLEFSFSGLLRFAPSYLASLIGLFSFEEESEISSALNYLKFPAMFVFVAILRNVVLFANSWPQTAGSPTKGEDVRHKVELARCEMLSID